MTVQNIANRPIWGSSPSRNGVEQAWSNRARNGEAIVAVIDSGIDASHPHLVGSVSESVSFTGEHRDTDGQGTHVAGIIASGGRTNYGAETVSLAPPDSLSAPTGQVLRGSGFAAPVVTGLAASIASANPNLTGEELKNKLIELTIPAHITK